jgi:hypothetical protein
MDCSYQNSLGVPGQGFHTHVGGIAIADVIATFMGAWLITRFTGWTLLPTTLGFFILGVLLHHIFCVKTSFGKLVDYISVIH